MLTDSDYANFERAVRKYYLTREKRSMKSTYEKLLQDFCTTKTDDGRLKLLAPSETLTLRQFQYWLSKNSDVITKSKKRDGEKARMKKYWSVNVSYDPCEIAHIYIWDNGLKRYDTCHLLDWNSKNAGKMLAEIIYEQQAERIEGKRLKAAAIDAKVNLNADIDSIIAEAKKAKTSTTPKSKSEHVSKILENRTVERTKL